MVTEVDPLRPESVAAAIAPVIDRLRLAVAHLSMGVCLDAMIQSGLGQEGGRTFAMLRNLMPDRQVSVGAVRTVFRYVPEPAVEAGLTEVIDAGLVTVGTDGLLGLTDNARSLQEHLLPLVGAAVGELWKNSDTDLAHLCELADRAVQEAAATSGLASAVLAPPYDPPRATAAARLAERLSTLRFHRFDAHIAAWERAGLTVETVQTLPAGPERDAVEVETNRRAAAPYAVLKAAERFELLAGLAALRN